MSYKHDLYIKTEREFAKYLAAEFKPTEYDECSDGYDVLHWSNIDINKCDKIESALIFTRWKPAKFVNAKFRCIKIGEDIDDTDIFGSSDIELHLQRIVWWK